MSRPALGPVLRLVFGPVGVSVALVLAACGGDSSGTPSVSTSAPSSDPSSTEAPPATEPTTGTASTTTPATAAPTTPEIENGPCPVGTWLISTEALQGFYDIIGERSGVTFVVRGSALLRLTAESTFEYQFQDYGLSQSVAGRTTEVTIAGTVGGTYTTDGTRFATTITAPDVTASATVDGAEIDASAILQGVLAEFPLTNATYTCDGSDLVVDFRVLDGTVPVRLVPA